MTTAIQTDFPYDIIYRSATYELAKQAGFNDENIWSVVEGDDNVLTYGPPHHFINVIYWVVTKEAHDHNTYYEEDE